VIYGTVEDHEPCGIAGYNLGQNPGRRRYLLIPALVRYQSLQNLLPDGIFMFGRDAFLSPFLKGGSCLPEPLLPFNPAISFRPKWQISSSPIAVRYGKVWQSRKFCL
jgi:hypothetical protein